MGRGLVYKNRSDLKDATAHLRLTAEERARLDEAAQASGLTPSEVIRVALVGVLAAIEKPAQMGTQHSTVMR